MFRVFRSRLLGILGKPGVSGLFVWLFVGGVAYGQSIMTVAGDGTFGYSGDGGPGTDASLADPSGVHVDGSGNLYIVDTNNRRIRKVDPSGTITTVAGNGNSAYSGDGGPGTDASLADPSGVHVDGSGNLYIADTNNQRIRKVDLSGTITTVAGNGNSGFAGDGGPATDARLNFPSAVYVDGPGNLYIADRANHRIRKVDPSGTITTVAGNGGFGSSGDGGAATAASLAFPSGVYVDGSGNLFIADRFNFRIRRVDGSGIITTVAGNGTFGFAGDGGAATAASLAFPSGVYVDGSGNLLIADRDNHRIRQVDSWGTITTIAGGGVPSFAGDGGTAVNASLNWPSGVYGDSAGSFYIADTNNRRIRKVAALIRETTPASGLSGAIAVAPGEEFPIFSIGITGDGTSSVDAVSLTLSDLSSGTGLAQRDFFQLQIYQSEDAVLDGGDSHIGTLSQGSIQIGFPVTLLIGASSIPPIGMAWFYFVSAEMNTILTDGHAFKVGFAPGGVTTSSGDVGSAVVNSDNDRATLDVVATQLVFTVQPGESANGLPLTIQPIVTALDANGNVDLDFSELVTLTESSPGSLVNPSMSAVAGVAVFPSLIYTATADQEVFALTADDEPGGPEADLPPVTSSSIVCDVVATQLLFSVQQAGSVSGQALATQPVVVAQDASGQVDTGFNEIVTLTHGSPGSLANHTQVAASGVATFTDLTYTATADGETFSLTADDVAGGVEGDLPAVTSIGVSSDAVATQLLFAVQPAGSVSGQVLTSQPVVVAQNGSGLLDLDFVETVTLTTGAPGSLTGQSVSAMSGVAAFANLTYRAVSDGEMFSLTANDVAGGVEGDLPPVTSVGVSSDVVATQLVFAVQPGGSVSGQALGTQPVVVAQDGDGMVDVKFAETVTLTTGGAGVILNFIKAAVSGVATFTNLTYTATADGETFRLTADDVAGGAESDLPAVTSVGVPSDVVATQLVFSVQPAGSVSGRVLTTQPVVVAKDDKGVTDADFLDRVALTTDAPGSLTQPTKTAVSGIATFTNLTYTATSDPETFALRADDETGGGEGDLPPVLSALVTARSLDSYQLVLVFDSDPIPADGASVKTVGVLVLDTGENIQYQDSSTVVTLTVGGTGVGGGTASVRGGIAIFPVTSTTVFGTVTLNATSGNMAEVTGSFTTFAGEAHQLALVYDSKPLPSDGLSTRSVMVQVLDVNGNLRTLDDTTRVTLAVAGAGSGGGSETVSGGKKLFVVTGGSTPGLLSLNATSDTLVEATGTLTVGFLPADLVVSTDPVGPSEVFRAEAYTVAFDIENRGIGPTVGDFGVEVYLVGGPDSIKVGEEIITEPLAPDSSRTVTLSFLLPSFSFASLADVYQWVAKVDAGQVLEEAEENNNIRSGNAVVFPIILVPNDSLQMGSVLLNQSKGLTFEIFNHGLAPLFFEVVPLDNQIVVAPDSVAQVLPGEGRVITVLVTPRQPGPFLSTLQISSSDPKGDVLVDVHGMVVLPERVFLDFNLEPENQGQTLIEASASHEIPVEVYVKDLPAVRGVSITLQFDPVHATYVDSSWEAGSFFSDAFVILEEEMLAPGLIEFRVGAWAGGGGKASGHLGDLKLRTTSAYLGNDDVVETVVRVVGVRYLQKDGRVDSLQVLSEATIVFKRGGSWPDLDENGIVDFADFLIFLKAFKHDATSPGWNVELPELRFPQTPYKRFDIDGDGRIGFFDFLSFADAYSKALGKSR